MSLRFSNVLQCGTGTGTGTNLLERKVPRMHSGRSDAHTAYGVLFSLFITLGRVIPNSVEYLYEYPE